MQQGIEARSAASESVKVLKAALAARKDGRPAALVTIIGIAGSAPRTAGSKMLVYGDGEIVGTVGGGTFEYKVIEAAIDTLKSGTPTRFSANLSRDLGMCCGGEMEAYIEPLETVVDLVIYGAGHVGTATARLADIAGFRVTLVDERPDLTEPEDHSPGVHVICGDPIRQLESLPWGMGAYHLVVTHSHQLDQDLVEAILPREFGWFGMIGSRTKVTKFFLRFRAAGMDETLFSKLSAPVGLDIGAETPDEIAVSIVADLVRVKRRSMHAPAPLSDQQIDARGGDGMAHPPALNVPG